MFEGIHKTNIPQDKDDNNENSLEKLKSDFRFRLQSTLNVQVIVDNIGNFADDALNQLLELNEDVLEAYKKEFENNLGALSTTEVEDLAY